MRFEPTPHAWLAWPGEDLVILSLADEQYSCLPGYGDMVIQSERGDLEVRDAEAAEELIEAGLIRPVGRQLSRRDHHVHAAWTDLEDVSPRSPCWRDRLDMARAVLFMTQRYYGRPLAAMVAGARQARPEAPRPDDDGLVNRAMSFRTLLPWTPWQGECLFRSFMLLSFLRMAGFDASWVFGVRTWPFQAHCWLQAGDMVLDDAADRVATFTPILVV